MECPDISRDMSSVLLTMAAGFSSVLACDLVWQLCELTGSYSSGQADGGGNFPFIPKGTPLQTCLLCPYEKQRFLPLFRGVSLHTTNTPFLEIFRLASSQAGWHLPHNSRPHPKALVNPYLFHHSYPLSPPWLAHRCGSTH